MTWLQSHSGRAISFLTPDPEHINIADIAVQLSRAPRFVGAMKFNYSVAQHSLHVMQIVKDASPTDVTAQLWGLLHDAHEAYCGDIPTPLQQAVKAMLPTYWPDPIAEIKNRLDHAIALAFGIEWADVEAVRELVKRADLLALSTEAWQLMPAPHDWKLKLPEPCPIELLPNSPGNVEFLFRVNFDRLWTAYSQRKNHAFVATLEAAE